MCLHHIFQPFLSNKKPPVRDLAYKAIQIKEVMTKEKGSEPTIEEIAKSMGVEKEELVYSYFDVFTPHISTFFIK